MTPQSMTSILHLSDLHLGPPDSWQRVDDDKYDSSKIDSRTQKTILSQAIEKLVAERERFDPIAAVVISGDLVLGKHADLGFEEFTDFVKPLTDLVRPDRVIVVPGNHDVPKEVRPSESGRYDAFLKVTRHQGFVTPLLDGIDFSESGTPTVDPQARHLASHEDEFVIVPVNSSHFCWGLHPLEDEAVERALRRAKKNDKKAVERLLHHDIPRISNAQMRAIHQFARVRDPDLLEPHEKDGRLRIAVLHHHLLPVSSREEFTSFESLTNLGAVRLFLAQMEIDLVLHGHKHETALYWDYVANEQGLDAKPHRMLVSAAPGDFRPRRPALRVIRVEGTPLAREVVIEDIMGPSAVVGALDTDRKRARIWRDTDPDRVGDATVVRDQTRDGVYEKLLSLFADRAIGNPLRDLVCEIEEAVDIESLMKPPNAYPVMKRVADPEKWMEDLVNWWQLKDPQLLSQVTFNHGNRIYSRFGDQVQKAAAALATADGSPTSSTRAFISLVDPRSDGGRTGEFPSFVSVHLQLVNDSSTQRLDCTGYFRKQEMRYWWPINVAELALVREAVEREIRKRGLITRQGRLRTISSYAAAGRHLPTVALASIDRAVDQHPKDLWEMAHGVARQGEGDSAAVRQTWERYLDDLDPPDEPEPVIQLSYQGLRRVYEMLGWLGGAESEAGKALDRLAHFYAQLVEQRSASGEQVGANATTYLGELREALDKILGQAE
ncbi:MAG: metallophosphoesterase [Actinobacteria bacterium]|nr:metallophosphoesterase [Actinomycetota bacterium]